MFGSSATPHDFGVSLGSEFVQIAFVDVAANPGRYQTRPFLNVASMPSAIEIYDLSEA